jgi:hypothetical protein
LAVASVPKSLITGIGSSGPFQTGEKSVRPQLNAENFVADKGPTFGPSKDRFFPLKIELTALSLVRTRLWLVKISKSIVELGIMLMSAREQ